MLQKKNEMPPKMCICLYISKACRTVWHQQRDPIFQDKTTKENSLGSGK